jgi:hypothetical protein
MCSAIDAEGETTDDSQAGVAEMVRERLGIAYATRSRAAGAYDRERRRRQQLDSALHE